MRTEEQIEYSRPQRPQAALQAKRSSSEALIKRRGTEFNHGRNG
ncbi:hypothetical protein D1AOALGA4SA_6842 [Olavius algarvensis Delta 1 endosymbiont]|nr:hypothetical protein D1AOALGA4SA_6842 [Olavius algarvensis Delta 1 endosymbiont]